MDPLVKKNELLIRLGVFFGILVVMFLWELIAPRRPLTTSKITRWFSNLGLVLIESIVVRLVFPTALAGITLLVQQRGWGLFNQFELPYLLKIIFSVLILDFVIYLQHIMFHSVPLFWRLHMVHHTDMDIDVTTGVRFHPVEIILSLGIKMIVVILIGAPLAAALIFEIILNGTSMFNHGNVRYSQNIDSILRLLVVTPEMHRVHHSTIRWETNSNLGFNFPWWDRLFGTYRGQPAKGHLEMTIGLEPYKEPKKLTLPWLIVLPFIGKLGKYPMTRSPGVE
ncbi:MAG: fatty acid hydroxylase [Deltaproteobacteria bacterium CG03_land_8_20_14_0_80_45_14]|nr:MAG: fatty acid hydroxylase [Deltaproteobacteria bacterium CG03_land_8_20_14_0_80_45_14]